MSLSKANLGVAAAALLVGTATGVTAESTSASLVEMLNSGSKIAYSSEAERARIEQLLKTHKNQLVNTG